MAARIGPVLGERAAAGGRLRDWFTLHSRHVRQIGIRGIHRLVNRHQQCLGKAWLDQERVGARTLHALNELQSKLLDLEERMEAGRE